MDKGEKPAGMKDVSRAFGISIATVDRAFHDRPGVNPKTRARVLAMAQKLNYRPNLAARNLKLNRRLTIGVYLPEQRWCAGPATHRKASACRQFPWMPM